MKTILVTGAAGYIGRHVVKNALDRGYRVIAADFNFKGGRLHPSGLARRLPP